MTDTMSTIPSTPRRPARTYATGPVTRALRWFTVIAALGVTAWILVRYSSLPGTVAIHFDAGGQADDWGPRWSVLVLAAVMLLLSLGTAALSTRPRWFNYPLETTERTAQAVYREGERLMVWTGLGMQGVYAGISCSLLGSGGAALLVTGLVVMVGAVVLGIVRVVRAAR